MTAPLATIQSQLATVFLSTVIPPTRAAYVGGLLNTIRTQYSSAYTSSYLGTLDPALSTQTVTVVTSLGVTPGGIEVNLTAGYYISVAQSNQNTP